MPCVIRLPTSVIRRRSPRTDVAESADELRRQTTPLDQRAHCPDPFTGRNKIPRTRPSRDRNPAIADVAAFCGTRPGIDDAEGHRTIPK